ncbi:hypothetical protein GGI11_005591 [Coemansia sp. RSA 2049]|nr:hypothetical protein GGI11_005591 [Coemansia sp. RSA 2049]
MSEYRQFPDQRNLLYRQQHSQVSMLYMYTHSEYSSSLSSLSTSSRETVHSHYTAQQQQPGDPSAGNGRGAWMGAGYWARRLQALERSFVLSDRARGFVGRTAGCIVVASSAGFCLVHGIFESNYQFSSGTAGKGAPPEIGGDNGDDEAMTQSSNTLAIGALQMAGFVVACGMSRTVVRLVGGSGRAALLVGAVLSGGGLLTAGYTGTLWQLCLTQGVVVGVGCGISYGVASQAMRGPATTQAARGGRLGGSACCRGGGGIGALVGELATGVGGCALALAVQRVFQACGSSSPVTLRWLSLLVGGLQAAGVPFAGDRWGWSSGGNNGGHPGGAGSVVAVSQQPMRQSITQPSGLDGGKQCNAKQTQHASDACCETKSWRMTAEVAASYASVCLYRMCSMVPVLLMPGYVDQVVSSRSGGYSGTLMLAALSLSSAVGQVLGSVFLPSSRQLPDNTAAGGARRDNVVRGAVLGMLALSVWGLWLPASRSWAAVSVFCVAYGVLFGALQQSASRAPSASGGAAGGRLGVAAAGALLGQAGSVVVGICVAGWLFIGAGNGQSYAPSIAFAASAGTAAMVAAVVAAVVAAASAA